MLTFIAFILTMAGSINWLLIGMLQYDFIAGLFGYQASIFSRIIYILFGIGAVYLIIRVIANKGSFKIWERRKKKKQQLSSATNLDASEEQVKNYETNHTLSNTKPTDSKDNSLFDEHLQK